jgi:cell division protein FtsA
MRFRTKSKNMAVIDIGSGKIACWVAAYDSKGNPSLLGKGYGTTEGLFGGHLTNISALEKALSYVVYEAEKSASVRIKEVILTLNGSFFQSDYHTLTMPIAEGRVSNTDIQNMVWQISKKRESEYHALHVIPLDFQIDGLRNIQDPRGIVGKEMTAHIHVMWIYSARLKTLLECLKRCQINVLNVVFSGYTSALACLVQDERDLGATLLDVGAGGTTLSCFFQGKMVASHFIPLGGYHVTHDIARGCETSLKHAERLKILYGATLPLPNDHKEMIPVLPLGERRESAVIPVPQSFLVNVIQARVEEILRSVRYYLQHVSTVYPLSVQRVVVTGGGSRIPGFREKTQSFLERPVRMAEPLSIDKQSLTGEFSAIAGAFFYNGMSELMKEPSFFETQNRSGSKMSQVFSWLRKNL